VNDSAPREPTTPLTSSEGSATRYIIWIQWPRRVLWISPPNVSGWLSGGRRQRPSKNRGRGSCGK
jgi:hypothetical protein